ncbi:hybrid sensor histidine kinase/response regulator [Methylomonas lenta]|uniref:Sensory/regulatory protein RpfC n=1 Tax=Methylomonas lenta TaxID=980561 RepID=A0A177NKY0_9GAMM|nr:PAS domain-containing protein [Methylomonas lenta]OAI18667.1 hybrid sensor histidine kinase/response regulator [Methylomonas lenta]
MTVKSTIADIRKLRIALIAAFLLFAAGLAADIFLNLSGSDLSWGAGLPIVIGLSGLSCLLYCFIGFPRLLLKTSTSRACFDRLPQPAIVLDRQGLICNINQAAADMVNQAKSSLLHQPIHNWFHPSHLTEHECLLCQHIHAGQELAATDFVFSKSVWQQISLSHLPGNNLNLLLQLHFDISSRKRIEEQMALVIDGAKLGFWDWDYLTGKHEVNQHWLDMLGLTADELDNYISDWDHRIHPDDHEHVRDVVAKHIKLGTPYVVEFRMQHKNGHWVWIQGSGSVVERDPLSGYPARLCGIHQNINARKESENNLLTTYRIISQTTSVVFKWEVAAGLPVAFVTENVLSLLGLTAEQVTAKPLLYLSLIHPDDLPVFNQEINSCEIDQKCTKIEHLPYRLLDRNGHINWVRDQKLISRNVQGQVIGYQGLVTNITRQRQQTSAIRNIISRSMEESSNHTALDNLTLLAAETLAADYTFIGEILKDGHCNTLSFCAQTKATNPADYSMHPSLCRQLAAGKICNFPQHARQLFAEDPWLQDHEIESLIGIPLYNDQQRIFGYLLAMYRQPTPDSQLAEDILKLFAAQITAELERAQAIKELKIQKQRLINAQSISHIGDWQWHWSDNHFSWSDEMYCITATSRTNFIPSFASILTQLVHPDDRNLFKSALQNSNSEREIDFKHRIVLSDGEIRHVHQRGKLIYDDKQNPCGIRGTMQDITEHLKTELRLLEAKQDAEKATQVKSEFLANMSHEIRTPMNAIVGLVELCLNSNISSKQRDYLERVETAALSLTSLIDDILDFSKMESGKLQLDSTPFLLAEMLDQVFSTMAELCNRKQLKLIRPELDRQQHAVIGDSQRLRQILINLIGNAIKFTEHGQIEVILNELSRNKNQVTLQFSIRDTGIGMSQTQIDKLFKAFSQGDSSITRNYGGTGLGLVICKQLVEQMGGSISVSSQLRIGSCFNFTVLLGVTEINNWCQPQPQSCQVGDTDMYPLQGIRNARILLVEDNEVNRFVAIELLTQAFFKVDTAENGAIALEMLEQNTYDCVLMDVQMPVMDGYQATRALRKLPGCSHLPVIAISANVMSDDRKMCLQAGMDDFIGKPILPQTLYATLSRWLSPQHDHQIAPSSDSNEELPYLYGIDEAAGLRYSAGDKSVFRKILQKFAENHATSIDEVVHAIACQNFVGAKHILHTLKGLAGSLGAVALHGHVVRLEELLAEQNSSVENSNTFKRLISLCDQELNRVVGGIQTYLPPTQMPVKQQALLSTEETQCQLSLLVDKLQAFDSDADRHLERILSAIEDPILTQKLLLIRKKIADYEFVEAALAVSQLLEFTDN